MLLFEILIVLMTIIALAIVIIPQRRVGASYLKISISLLLVLLIAGTGFYFLADPSLISPRASQQTQLTLELETKIQYYKQHPKALLSQLQQRLANNPNSAQGWYLLARLYQSVGEIDNALKAFSKAYQLNRQDPKSLLNYAMALSFEPGVERLPQAQTLLKQLIQLQPQNDEANTLLATNAYRLGDYQYAINLWESLLPHYSPDSEIGKTLLKAIAQAQQHQYAARNKGSK